MSVNLVKPTRKPRSDDVFQEIFDSQGLDKPFLRLVVGDGSSASLKMKVGLPSKKNQQVRVGETVEVLVLSDIKSLSRFMAVRDVYLPDVDLWLAEEPCLERPVFESLVETLRAASSSSYSGTPALEGRDTQAAKARLPDSVDMIPGSSVGAVSPEPQTAKRWRLAQLDYEEYPNEIDDDPKLQALRRLGQNQRDREFQRRDQAPTRQYMRMPEYSSDSEDIWEPETSNRVPNQAKASADDKYYGPDADEVASSDYDGPKVQAPGRFGQDLKSRELPRNLPADAYGPPMQYMRMEEYGAEVEDRREQDSSNILGSSDQPILFEGDSDDAQVPDDSEKSRQIEQLTSVDEFLGSGVDKMRSRESGVELVQEEEF